MKGHQLEVADVPSCRSVPFLNSFSVLNNPDLDRTVAVVFLGRFENSGRTFASYVFLASLPHPIATPITVS